MDLVDHLDVNKITTTTTTTNSNRAKHDLEPTNRYTCIVSHALPK